MGKIMFIDTECNSLDTQRGFIQELAWAIYDIDSKRLLKARSHIVKWNMAYSVEPGAFETTGLSRDFCEANGLDAKLVFAEFLEDLALVDCLCGHNFVDYDQNMLISNIVRCMFAKPHLFTCIFIVDTMYDIQFPKSQKVLALKYLAFDHGYILSDAHQALADVFACAAIFFKYPFSKIVQVASTPLVTLSGFTEYLDEPGREAFYQAKFRWNKPKRRWERRCRAYHIEGAQLTLGNRPLFCDDKKVSIEKEPEQQELEIPF